MKKFALILSMVCVIIFSTVTAFANQTQSSTKYSTVNNKTYGYYAQCVSISNYNTYAVAVVGTYDGSNVNAGYMGAAANLYNSAGTCIRSTGFKYSAISTNSTSARTVDYVTSGTFYAIGAAAIYNGNGYYTDNTYQTAMCVTSSSQPALIASIPTTEYKVNENKETYGLGIQVITLGKYPDLIQAMGVDGTVGYIKYSDLMLTPKTPEEALAQQNINRTISLYQNDGKTIIGSYEIGGTSNSDIKK